ncbi:MAG: FG-GAP-like repeat-containing protein [Ignavibacteriales bacterium]|nr:FG-GAP-like repeat-containing protein [Ignavibacteriales bacterium]
MRNSILISLSLLFLTLSTFAQVPTNGLVAYYPFNGNTNDMSGSNYHITNYGAVLTTDRFSQANSAYDFDGTNAYMTIPDSSKGLSFNAVTDAYTVSVWANFSSLPSRHIHILTDRLETGGWSYYLNYDQVNKQISFTPFDGSNIISTVASCTLQTSTWYHFLLVISNKSVTLYINGASVMTATIPAGYGSTKRTSNVALIGASAMAGPSIIDKMVGKIDDLRIYNRALNVTEILALYFEGVPTVTSFSPMSGPVGTTVTITGTNFNTTTSANVVFFGAVQATVSSAASTSLSVLVPAGATYQPLTVTCNGLTGCSAKSFVTTFTSSGTVNVSSFAGRVDFPTSTKPRGFNVADLDGDGKPDVVTCSENAATLSVLRNTSTSGSVAFASKLDIATGTTPLYLAIGDIDGDGKPDLVVPNYGSNTMSVFRNTGTSGTISFAAKVDYPTSNTPYAVALADFDGDGKLDIGLSNYSSVTASVFRNLSTPGTISLAGKVDVQVGSSAEGIAVGDVDGDGKPDLVVVNGTSASVGVFRNTTAGGTISFSSRSDFGMGNDPHLISVADIDGDGRLDLIGENAVSQSISVLRNTGSVGSVSFATKVDYPVGTNPLATAIGDVDGDGKVDVLVVESSANTVSLFKNGSSTGSISLASRVSFTTGASCYNARIVDLDGDGKPDLVVANYGDNSVSVLRNISVPALPGEYTPDANTVLLLHMDETSGLTVSDASSSGNNGTATGTSIINGKFGKGRSFNGTTDYIDIPHTASLNSSTNLTIEAWVTLNQYGGNPHRYVFSKGTYDYALLVLDDGRLAFNRLGYTYVAKTVALNRMTHLAAVVSGTQLTLYKDGVVDTTINMGGGLTNNSQNLRIGGSSAGSEYWAGLIDEIRISNMARLPHEFGLQLPPKNLAATVSGTTINLSWQNGGGLNGLLRYKIYRGGDSTNVTLIDSTSSTSYTNSNLLPGRYYYRVSAVDSTGFEGSKGFASGAIIFGLVASFPFSGSANDLSGNGNNGTGSSVTATADRFGTANAAYSFNGTSSLIVVPNSSSLRISSDITVCAWVKASSPQQGRGIVEKYYGGTNTDQGWLLNTETAGTAIMQGRDGRGGATTLSSGYSTGFSDGQWHFVVGQRLGNIWKIFLDGQLSSSTDVGGTAGSIESGGNIAIGAYGNLGPISGVWQGSIDDIRIYNKSLSVVEIDSLYHLNGWPVLPTITTVTPVKFSASISPTAALTAVFDSDMNQATFTASTIKIRGSLGGAYTFTPSYSAGTRTLTLTPTTSFKKGEIVSATLTRGIKSAAGDSLKAPYVWNFNVAVSGGVGSFTASQTLDIGGSPTRLAAGDYDKDGDLDLAVVTNSQGTAPTVTLLRNNGQGTYASWSTLNVGVSPSYILTSDVDLDGDMDLIIGRTSSGAVLTYLNDGTGSFTLGGTYALGQPSEMSVGDMNGDGYDDVALSNISSQQTVILKNNGNGQLSSLATLSIYGGAVRVTDVDGDGDMDVVVFQAGNPNPNALHVAKNDGKGSFAVTSTAVDGIQGMYVSAGDFDGDGDIDLVLADAGDYPSYNNSKVRIYKNNGSGSFALFATYACGNYPVAVAIGDYNNDGKLDFAVSEYTGQSVSVFIGNGDASFTKLGNSIAVSNAFGIVAGDLDGNGALDLAVANYPPSGGSVTILKSAALQYGLVAYYPFTGNAGDSSGYANHGSTVGGVSIDTDRFNRANSAYSLNGATGYVQVPSSTTLRAPSTALTLSGWINIANWPGTQVAGLIQKTNTTSYGQYSLYYQGYGTPGVYFNFITQSGSQGFGAPISLQLNQWYFVVGTWDGITAKIYVNNSLLGSQSVSGQLVADSNPLTLGLDSPGSAEYLQGKLDDIRIYDRSLSAAEVDSLYRVGGWPTSTSTLPGEYSADANTVLLLHMNETSGSMITDASGNANTGTATGTSILDGRFGKGRNLNGSSEWIDCGNSQSLQLTSALSIDGWIKLSAYPGSGYISFLAGKFDGSAGDANNNFCLGIQDYGNPILRVGGVATTLVSRTIVPINTWVHLAATFDVSGSGANMKIYVNGVLDTSSTRSSNAPTNGYPLLLGKRLASENHRFFGLMDEVRVSNKARTPQEFDLQRPPTNVSAAPSGTTANLTWQNGGGGVSLLRYRIYRGADSTTVTQIDSTSSVSWTNTGLTATSTYYYRISAVDITGFEGVRSYAAKVVVPSLQPTTIALASGNNQSSLVSTALANPFVVTITDVGGNPVPGVSVTYAISSVPSGATGQSLSTTTTTTNSSGQASTLLTLGNKTGTYTVTAISGTLTGSPIAFTATGTVTQATTIALTSGNTQSAPISTPLTNPMIVTVTGAGGNPVAGVNVSFTIASSPTGATGQALSATSATSNSIGQASTALTLGNKVGTYSVTATAGGLSGSPVTFTATSSTGPATAIALTSGNYQTGPISAALGSPFVVTVTDAGGNPVSGITVGFSLASVPSSATGQLLSTTNATTNSSGQASAILTLGNKTGTYSVTATSGNLTGSPLTFTATAGVSNARAITLSSGNGQSAVINSALSAPFVVTVTDTGGNPVSGVNVSFAITLMPDSATGQSLSISNSQTNSSGQASTVLTLGSKVGTYTVTATSGTLSGSPILFTSTALVGPARSLVSMSGDNQSVSINAPLPSPLVVKVTDQGGNPVSGVGVTFAISSAPTGASGQSLSIVNAITNSVGQVSSVLTVGGKKGTYTVTATSSGLSGSPITFTATAGGGAATTIALTSGNNQSAQIGLGIPNPFVVTIVDQGGNGVSGVNVSYAITSVPTGAAGQSLSTSSAVTNANGQSSTILTLGNKTGAYVVTAASAGLAGNPVLFTATATIGPAKTITLTSGNGQSAPNGSALTSPFVVTVTDDGGNPVPGVTISFGFTSTPAGAAGHMLSAMNATTNVNGQALTTLTLGNKAGSYLVTATSGNLNGSPVTFSATATTSVPTTMSLTSGSIQSAAINNPLPNPFVVTITDASGNPVQGVGVSFAIASTPGGATGQSLSIISGVTNSSGQTSTTLTLGNRIGAYSVNASASGLNGSPITFTCLAVVGTGKNITSTSGNNQLGMVGSAVSNPFVVTVTDEGGNPVSGSSVNFEIISVPPSATGQSLSIGTSVTSSNGQALTTLTLGSKVGLYSVAATSTGLSGSPLTFTVTATPRPASQLTLFNGDGQAGPIGSALSNVLTARVSDVYDNPVAGINVNFAITATPSGATGQTLSSTSAISDVNGHASTRLTFGNKTGTYLVSASSGSMGGSLVTFTETATTGTARIITLASGNNQSAVINKTLGNPFVVTVTDDGGNPVSNVAVGFAISLTPAGSVGQSLSVSSTTTNASGQASTTMTLGSKIGDYAVTATLVGTGGNPVSFTATGIVGAAKSIAHWSGDNQSASINNPVTNPIVVVVTDEGGNPVPGTNVNFGIASTPSGATGQSLTFNTASTNANGLASTSLTVGNKIGTYSVVASSGSLSGSPVAFTITATPAAAKAMSLVAGDNQQAQISTTLQNSFVVLVTDEGGNPVPNVSVGFTVTASPSGASGHALNPPNTATDASGHASTVLTLGTKVGIYQVSAIANGLIGSPLKFAATATTGPAKTIALTSGNSQTEMISTVLPNPFVVTVVDEGGNAVSNVSVFFAIASVPSGATGQLLSVTNSTTNTNGQASSSLTLGNRIGVYTVTAMSGSLNGSPATFSATAVIGRPTKVAFSAQPMTGKGGALFSVVPVVAIQDAQGNTVTGNTAMVTVALESNPSGGTLSGITSVEAADGVATFRDLSIDKIGIGYTLVARSSGLTQATSTPFNVVVGPPKTISIKSGTNQHKIVTRVLDDPFIVSVMDAGGNSVPGARVSFNESGFPSGSHRYSLSTRDTTTNSVGQAATRLTLGDKRGNYSVTSSLPDAIGSNVVFTARGDYPADFTGDDRINVADLAIFVKSWQDRSLAIGDIGPVNGNVPDLVPVPDGKIDFEDLMVFGLMWNWTLDYPPPAAKSIPGLVQSLRGVFEILPGEIPTFDTGDTKQISLMLRGAEDIRTVSLEMEFDPLRVLVKSIDVETDNGTIVLKRIIQQRGYAVLQLASLGGTLEQRLALQGAVRITVTSLAPFFNEPMRISAESYGSDAQLNAKAAKDLMLNPGQYISQGFILGQNYPNPFNPSTMISYTLPRDAQVRLTVCDVLGHVMSYLVDQWQRAGTYEVQWNARTGAGAELPSGVYILRMTADEYRDSRKMLLLR